MLATVLIVFAEALAAPEVAWSLFDAGHEVIAIGRRGRRSALRHSSHVTVRDVTPPELDAATAVADLEEFCKNVPLKAGRPGVIFPLDDAAVWLCDRLALSTGWLVNGAQGPTTAVALDKETQIRAARDAGLPVPRTVVARTAANVTAHVSELPLVLRPSNAVELARNRLSKGRAWICSTPNELKQAVSEWAEERPLIVQPFIEGIGEGVFGLATAQGVQAWSAHRRLRMMNPHGSGSSACVSQEVQPEIREAVGRLVASTRWRGLFMVELLRDRTGTAWFVELNGRPWGSMALSRRQGLEYPAWSVASVLQPDAVVTATSAWEGPLVCRNVGREFMHLLFVLRGPRSRALRQWPSFWRTSLELLRVSRQDALYNWRRDDLKVFVSDCWYTVRGNLHKSKA